jgi:SanA protein
MNGRRLSRKFSKKLVYALVAFVVVTLLCSVYANRRLEAFAADFVFDTADSIKANQVALLLGTGPYLRSGVQNPYFKYRIAAALELFQKKKLRAIIVSGDNSRSTYNEPAAMRDALVAAGVPDSCIYLDYAGFRTLDSVVRAREIFGQTSLVIISQRFHNERAVYIARALGMQAQGFNARDVNSKLAVLIERMVGLFLRNNTSCVVAAC